MAALRADRLNPRLMIVPVAIMFILWAVAFANWRGGGDLLAALLVAYIGVFVGVGIGTYIALPRVKRPMGRRLVMVLLGTLLLLLALLTDHGNMQIEGLFFGLLAGAAPYILLHFTIAKVGGPLAFGRVWCGWACWFGMIFDLLPFPYSRYRIPGDYGKLRYVHFGVSLLLVFVLWFAFGYRGGATGVSGLGWFVGGLAVYYALGIGMAYALKDNRAFCKYLCPLSVLLKAGARFSLLKVSGTPALCHECRASTPACVELCPMNIRVRDYIVANQRVLSTECTLCQTCINVCPNDALTLSFKLDVGGTEYIDYEPPRARRSQGTTPRQ